MKHFWQGFQTKTSSQISFKKHVLVLFWDESSDGSGLRKQMKRLSLRYPSVKVKVVNATKDPVKPQRHNIKSFPTVLLLKDGREVERLSGETSSQTLLERLFRKANV